MKSKIFIFALTLVICLFAFEITSAKADTLDYQTIIAYQRNDSARAYLVAFYDTPTCAYDPYWASYMIGGNFAGYSQPPVVFNSVQEAVTWFNESDWQNLYFSYSGTFSGIGWNPNSNVMTICVIKGQISNLPDIPSVEIIDYSSPVPPTPVPSESWLSDFWEWILWQLGFNDDYSGDLIKITGGDKVDTEIVTPTPSPAPTPTPSPTPFTLDIVDNNGNPVYTITGIPNQTIVINQGDNIDNGSEFDIFEVDQIIGDGLPVSPRDGINDVMETNNDYIQDMDISSVQNSFSVLPADWLLMIGVLASLPFIAGFIAKLLK